MAFHVGTGDGLMLSWQVFLPTEASSLPSRTLLTKEQHYSMTIFKVLCILSHHLLSEILKQIMTIPEILSQSKCREQMTVGAQTPLLT